MAESFERLSLRHSGGSTTLLMGRDLLGQAQTSLAPWLEGRTVFAITCPTVRRLHGEALSTLAAAAARLTVLEVPDGEEAKDLEHVGRLWAAMVQGGGKRDSRLIAFGGGTVGDVGGFTAGCFLRGIEYIQVPTTLLAQVDAAIGGKTGIDWGNTKNSVGLFHHPAMVISDAAFLETLPREELRSALAEVVKTAVLLDPRLLETVETRLDALLAGEPEALEPVVVATARAKVRVVERDPLEGGERKLLNFGHTLGHALEAALGYRNLRHGDAVAYGMLFALRLALHRGLEPAVAQRCRELLGRFGLPPLPEVDAGEVLEAMGRDKKAREGGQAWILPVALGEGQVVEDLPPGFVAAELISFLRDPWASPPETLNSGPGGP